MCINTPEDGVKPDIEVVQIGMNRAVVNDFKINQGLSHRSSIVKGSSGQSIKHPSVGFVQTIETDGIKVQEVDFDKKDKKENKKHVEEYNDMTVFTEHIAQEVVMNMEEAYKIIKNEEKFEESGLSESNRSQEFAKKVKKLDLKSILAELSVSEKSC